MLEIRSLQKTFFPGTVNEVRALQGIDLSVTEGSWVMLLGMNGSGKSTLLNAVAGSFFPDSGAVSIGGRDITTWQEHRRAKLVGRVFQNPFSGTAPGLSIAENFSLAARRGLPRGLAWAMRRSLRQELRDRVSGLKMGLEDRLDNAIGSLSGGQRQALTLLMATWLRPQLLLLDEHTAALDPKSADQVIRLTQEVVQSARLTVLMVTHSMQQATSLGDRIIMLNKGRVAHDFTGTEKSRLRSEDLVDRFEEIRRRELLDESAARMLKEHYL
ncbi:MAG: ABC transporter ATP-binding protein [Terrimicrobiaceae bacterium]